jgi:energy-converting hydrogenase Eha subunit E
MSTTTGAPRGQARLPAGARLKNELDLGRIWPSFLVWLVVTGCTLGLGWLVVSGHFFRAIINSTRIVGPNGEVLGRLSCDYDAERRMGPIVLWVAVSIATLGVGLLFYSFQAARAALERHRGRVGAGGARP